MSDHSGSPEKNLEWSALCFLSWNPHLNIATTPTKFPLYFSSISSRNVGLFLKIQRCGEEEKDEETRFRDNADQDGVSPLLSVKLLVTMPTYFLK